ncbi:MAG: MATE family efflux transporter [Pseudomonadota bacterium]
MTIETDRERTTLAGVPLLTAPAARRILGVGLPIVGGMVSQNLLDLVDTIMVGRLGEAALAGVGIAGFANFLMVALLIGFAAGVQAVVARRKGEDRQDEIAVPLNGGIAVAFLVGLPLMVVGLWLAPTLYPLLVNGNEAVIAEGLPYFEMRLWGVLAIALNFSFRGYWYGIGETATYLKIIVSMHVLNAVLSFALIFGHLGLPALGTVGAGLGTTISLFMGTILYSVITYRRARPQGFLSRLPRADTFSSLLRLSIPSAVQTMLFAAGLLALFTIAGYVGVTALAISNILVNLSKFAVLPAMGLGFATMTLVSEALGRGDGEAASRWAWQTVQVALCAVVTVSLVLIAVPEAVLSLFTTDPDVLAAGVMPLRVVGAVLVAEGFAAVLQSALTGAGAARQAAAVAISSQWIVGLPAALVFGLVLDGGALGVWLGWSLSRWLVAGVLVVLWARGRWRSIRL